MPDYAIVDRTKLDDAMRATANAIREKQGNSLPMVWDEYTGFEIPVSAIKEDLSGDEALERTVVAFKNDRITKLGAHALKGCADLVSVEIPSATAIGSEALHSLDNLTTLDAPKVETIGSNAAYYCRNLKNINLPSLKTTEPSAFRQICFWGNASFEFKSLTTLGQSTFYGSLSIKRLFFPVVTSIGEYAFYGCQKLEALVLGHSRPALAAANAFDNSAIKSGGSGRIYIPKGEYNAFYTNATNWSALPSSLFVEYENITEVPS